MVFAVLPVLFIWFVDNVEELITKFYPKMLAIH